MLLNILLYINKNKLGRMILQGYSYDDILIQSQKIDVLINRKMKKEWHINV